MEHTNGTTPGLNTPRHTSTSPSKREALAKIQAAMPGNNLAAQCQRLREALSRYSLSTYQASRYLDVYDPPARIMQMRRQGVAVDTHWTYTATESGERHRVGLYVLAPGAGASMADTLTTYLAWICTTLNPGGPVVAISLSVLSQAMHEVVA